MICEGSSLLDVVLELTKDKNRTLLKKLVENNLIRPEIKILVNGRDVAYLKGLETELRDRDLISFLPVAGGG